MKQFFNGLIAGAGLVLLAFGMTARASEGMWLPSEQPDLINNIPLGAVVRVGSCSGVFVSAQGLLMTNAHCIEETMQMLSTENRRIRRRGYLAEEQSQELPAAPGFFASITLSQEDITAAMLEGVTERMSPRERHLRLTRNRNRILSACESTFAHQRCQVQEHQDGLNYLLVREQRFRDVRLVFVPANEVALFGGEAANWQWPRFAADVAIMRVYTDPNGHPADYNETNIPYQSGDFAQVADSHLTFFDMVRVAGYPGTTQRFRTAAEMQWAFSEQYPQHLRYLRDFYQLIKDNVSGDEMRSIRYQPTLLRLQNQITNLEAQLREYQEHGMQQKSERNQVALLNWLADAEREATYSNAWWTLQQQLAEDRLWMPQQLWWRFLQELSLPGSALLVHRYAYEQTLPADIRARGFQQRDLYNLQAQLESFAGRLDIELEKAILVYLLQRYQELPASQQMPAVTAFFNLQDGVTLEQLQARVEQLYTEPQLLDDDQRETWFERPLKDIESSQEPWLMFATQTFNDRLAMDAREIDSRGRIAYARPRMIAAQREFDQTQGRTLPANANRTLRISEGQVLGYRPDDNPNHFRLALTYLDVFRDHLIETEDQSLPRRFRTMVERHGQQCFSSVSRRSVPVNFISTADGTLGSSGSPTFNTEGRLVGLVFDLMAESTMSEWVYERTHHRLIHVDVRYVLWLLGYYYNANDLLNELGFNPAQRPLQGNCRIQPTAQVAQSL
ncbi:S46 family peptidase [Aliidiomarina celeris]|uniref:S46 family peptidase n=1 Tax=Aliidiomarina celeris TaxID=2249428 RepID=UPI000DEB170E|nr:S46 family peptidase [Aliidiomarina celeris]